MSVYYFIKKLSILSSDSLSCFLQIILYTILSLLQSAIFCGFLQSVFDSFCGLLAFQFTISNQF